MKPLPKGRYKVKNKETNFLGAAMNGHAFVTPGMVAKSDGGRVTFYDGKKKVWDCNANYAAANFIFEDEPKTPKIV